MVGFWIGVLVGAIASPLILAILAKPLMRLFLNRQANKLTENVLGRMQDIGDNFIELNNQKEEEDVKIKKQED